MGLKFWKQGGDRQHVVSDLPEDDDARLTLGAYEAEREIGRGSMGVVYLGREIASGREVAIKTMVLADYPDPDTTGNAWGQFLREARILAWLNHPDIVTIHDAGEERGLAFIAMEIAQGVKLTEFVRPGTLLPLPKALKIIARVADVLGYADEQNIAHRDIKPGNIMYDESRDAVKVMDFGIARMTHTGASLLSLVQGSPRYMSPEQAQGQTVDGRSDLFSLGTVLYQLASGHLPFNGETENEVMACIVKGAHVDILTVKPDTPSCVCAIIDRALQKDKEMRYRNGHEMADAIRRCIAGLQDRG